MYIPLLKIINSHGLEVYFTSYEICMDGAFPGWGRCCCTIAKNEQDSSFADPDGDSGSADFSIPDPGSASKNLGIFNPRNLLRIRDPVSF